MTGREDIFIGAEYAAAADNEQPEHAVNYDIDTLSYPDHVHGSFQMYRAFNASAAQNEQRKSRRLTMPVLALAGAGSSGDMVAATMNLVANDVQSVIIPDTGHWIAEEAPEQFLGALTAFLAPTETERALRTPGPRSSRVVR